MNTTKKIMAAMGLLTTIALHASTMSESEYLASYSGRTDIPIPVAVASPKVSSNYVGETVRLSFVVSPTGTPVDIKVIDDADYELKAALVSAVEQWKFKPLVKDGVAVTTHMVLPVRIVDTSG